jgi:type II secretory pathway pseudopilin PulG
VIVILGILLAISIPALTGYIAKAQDEQYIAMAHDTAVAMRAVLNEHYADGTLGQGLPYTDTFWQQHGDPLNNLNYLTDGEDYGNLKRFRVDLIGQADTKAKNMWIYLDEATTLIANNRNSATYGENGTYTWNWNITQFANKTSLDTMLTAPAFIYEYFPDGSASGNPTVMVVYGISGLGTNYTTDVELMNSLPGSDIICSPEAGYKVFHVTRY